MDAPRAVRSRYLAAGQCMYSADGQRASAERLSVRAMNFGQHWRTPVIVDVDYHVELPRDFLRDRLVPNWREIPGRMTYDARCPTRRCTGRRLAPAHASPARLRTGSMLGRPPVSARPLDIIR